MMTARTTLAAAALLLGVASSTVQAQRGTPDPERAAARQVLQALGTYLQDGKWTEADGMFATRGVHVLADTSAFHSWAEYRDKTLKPDLASRSELKVANTGVEAVVRGNVAWVAFRQEVSGGSAAAKVARGTAVLEKLEGKWTIVHYHVSR